MAELVHYEVEGPIATITLDSPHNRNALSRQLLIELSGQLDRAFLDGDVRVVVVRSSGRVFCSGADLSEAVESGMSEGARRIIDLQRQVLSLDKPVVAQVDGPVRAGGIGIVAAADIVVAADTANFALTEVKLGLAAAVISPTVLARMRPRSAASAFLGGEVFSADVAAASDLVTRVVPADEVAAEVERTCASLSSGSPQGLRESKALLNRDLLARLDADGDRVAELSARLFGSDEARAAMRAVLARVR